MAQDTPKGITVLGSTGSIGVSTLDVLARHKDRYRVVALTACSRVDRMVEQCLSHRPKYAVMENSDAAQQLQEQLHSRGSETLVLDGVAGLERVAALDEVEMVMAAIVGAAGLKPTLAAAHAGKTILLANKEALVMSGQIFMDAVRSNNATLLPIDSEHNAIFQCMPAQAPMAAGQNGVKRILLTASGGPFRNYAIADLEKVSPEQACAHANWDMGRKISVDSATMMNKGLEVIEACWLFNTTVEHIDVVIHPQSVIHSMVQYVDGSVLAQLGNPDMRTPIAHALAWPERMESGVADLDMFAVSQLNFERPDLQRFPCLRLAIEAISMGGTRSTVLNAANEVAVQAFLDGGIAFTDIANVIEYTLSDVTAQEPDSLDIILSADQDARLSAQDCLQSMSFSSVAKGKA